MTLLRPTLSCVMWTVQRIRSNRRSVHISKVIIPWNSPNLESGILLWRWKLLPELQPFSSHHGPIFPLKCWIYKFRQLTEGKIAYLLRTMEMVLNYCPGADVLWIPAMTYSTQAKIPQNKTKFSSVACTNCRDTYTMNLHGKLMGPNSVFSDVFAKVAAVLPWVFLLLISHTIWCKLTETMSFS